MIINFKLNLKIKLKNIFPDITIKMSITLASIYTVFFRFSLFFLFFENIPFIILFLQKNKFYRLENSNLLICFLDATHENYHYLTDRVKMNIEDIKTLFCLLKLTLNGKAIREPEVEEVKKQEDEIVAKPEKKYEEKYLEKIRKLPDEYIFNEEETALKDELFIQFFNNAVESLKNEKEELKDRLVVLQQELSDIENIEFSEEDKKPTYDEDIGQEIEPFEERIREKKNLFSEEVDTIKEKLIHLDEKVVSQEEIKEEVRNHIINQRLDKLKNNFIIEKTPLGNVLMFYNNKKDSFEYYSDNTMPYRFLEVVGRKYVLTFNCRFLYVDMEKELEKYEKKLNDEKEKLEREKVEKEKQEDLPSETKPTTKKNVFAKFKSYNKDAGSGRVNKAPPPKNSIPNNKVVKNNNEPVLLKEKANHYTYEGKFANFNILQKVNRKKIDKKYSMTFADFKKNIINKNKN